MNKPISIIIPTYLAPDHLSLCIESIVKGQANPENEILVIVDGNYETNKEVLNRWKDNIKVINFEENVGLPRGTNVGVSSSINELVLVINDDNLLGKNFDKILTENYKDGMCISMNQIEPNPSMFKQFYIKDLGRDPLTFDLDNFYKEEQFISNEYGREQGGMDNTGSTLPFFMSKIDYLKIGGWDIEFDKTGVVADWEFFLRCQLNHIQMIRTYRTHAYHFGSITTGTNRQTVEREGHEYSRFKWGNYIQLESHTNKKYLAGIN